VKFHALSFANLELPFDTRATHAAQDDRVRTVR
jgi:hypothetical protein